VWTGRADTTLNSATHARVCPAEGTGLTGWTAVEMARQYRKPVEEQWAPYVRGEITRDQAIERLVAAIGSAESFFLDVE
jgi:hypothetical protein